MARRAPDGKPRARHLRVVVDGEGAARRPGALPAWVLVYCVAIMAAIVGGWELAQWVTR